MKKSLLIIFIVFVVIFVRYLFAPVFEQLELTSYDWRAKMALDSRVGEQIGGQIFGKKFKGLDRNNIIIVEIDDYSRNQLSKHPELNLGPWPWRRDVWSSAVKFIERSKPKAILFDLIFADNATVNSYQDTKLSWMFRNYDNVVIATSLNHPKNLVDKYQTKDLIKNSDFFIKKMLFFTAENQLKTRQNFDLVIKMVR